MILKNLIKIIIIGATGKMGQEVIKMVFNTEDFELVAVIDTEENLSKLAETVPGIYASNDIVKAIKITQPDVAVDFTHPDVVLKNALTILKEKVSVVIGTTGIKQDELAQIKATAEEAKVGAFIAPNFALGAVLMIELSKQIAKHFSNVEIIEMHNPLKADSPSGTALKTVEAITSSFKSEPKIFDRSIARGHIINNIPVHSIRLPGVVAHQQVIFGSQGQTLTIKHDSYDRTSFMPGVALAIRKIFKHKGLIYGLENILK